MLPHLHPTADLVRSLPPLQVAGWIALVGAAISWVAGALADAAIAVWSALVAVWAFLKPILWDVWHAVKPIWSDVLKPFWTHVQAWFSQLRKWWTQFSKPVLDTLEKIHKIEQAIYAATFQPIIETISNLEKLLVLLHLQHTELGKALYDALAQVDHSLTDVWQQISAPINAIISKIEGFILDVNGLLQADLLLNSVFKNIGGIWNIWWTAALPRLSEEGRQALTVWGKQLAVAEHHAAVALFLKSQEGPLAEDVRGAVDAFNATRKKQDPPGYAASTPEFR